MDLIREFVALMSEGMKTVDDMPEGYFVYIDQSDMSDVMFRLAAGPTDPLYGVITLHRANEKMDGGPCDGAWVISSSNAIKGWGPLLYDVAMEWASQNGAGLTPDRQVVSEKALAVWRKYMSRSDVQQHRLSRNSCRMVSVKKHTSGLSKLLLRSPLAYRFTKTPTQMQALLRADRLRFEE